YKSLLDNDLWGEPDKSKLRTIKPKNGVPPRANTPTENQLRKLRKLKPNIDAPRNPDSSESLKLQEGTVVNHSRFGKGKVLKLEGVGQDKKAEIQFERGDIKKLLLRFAKLEVLSD
ncbi:MAG: ATP-dependent DNA helicase, partial [Bacteroidota bacterium]